MMYSINRLAPGSYDVIRDGEIVAALVAERVNSRKRMTWVAELLAELPAEKRPSPFIQTTHEFGSLAAAREWLGVPGLVQRQEALRSPRDPVQQMDDL